MYGLRIAPLIACFIIVGMRTGSLASEGYARFCSSAQTETEAKLRAINLEQRNRFPVQQSDAALIDAARKAIHSAAFGSSMKSDAVSIAYWNYSASIGQPSEGEILFRVGDSKVIGHVFVTFEKTGRVRSLRLATVKELASLFEFGRIGAAYILFNDLTASDATIPRRGCKMAFREQFYAMPEILPEILSAVRAQPAQDRDLLILARRAFDTSVLQAKVKHYADGVIARRTLKSIGPNPSFTLIYRDQDRILGSRAEADVVRIAGKKRAYAMFSVDADGKTNLGPMPLCVVGDMSCAMYYGWP